MTATWIVIALGCVVAAAAAAWLAGRLMHGNGFGLLGDTLVALVGAVAGAYVYRAQGGMVGTLVVAFFSALFLLFVVRLFTGRRSGRRLWS